VGLSVVGEVGVSDLSVRQALPPEADPEYPCELRFLVDDEDLLVLAGLFLIG
jgi:hypothetical protein